MGRGAEPAQVSTKAKRPLAWTLALLVCVVACASPATTTRDTPVAGEEPPPRFAAGGADAEEFGASAGYPKGDRATFWDIGRVVGSHSHLDEIFPGRLIHRAPAPSRLLRVAEPRITWAFQGADLTLDDYLMRNPTTGLLIARGDRILVERYQYGRMDRHRFTSWSMAKTATAMLVGIAIDEGRIRSVDDPAAAYVPALVGTEYGRTSLRHLLQMSSGVRFRENYSGNDDVMRLVFDTYLLQGAGGVGAVTSFNERDRPAGTKFSYASVETQVLGLVLRAVTGRPVAAYLEEKIWQPIGAEADATWLISKRQLARPPDHPGGMGQGRDDRSCGSTASPARRACAILGYGYQTWILPGERRMFFLWGVRGQRIYVDPRSKLVMVNTAVHKLAVDVPRLREMDALWSAVVRQLGG